MKKNKALCVLLSVLVVLPCLGLVGCGKQDTGKECSVLFSYNSVVLGDETIKVKKGSTIPGAYLNPHQSKYHFRGWYKNPAFTENSIWNSTDIVTSDIVLFAKWERKY